MKRKQKAEIKYPIEEEHIEFIQTPKESPFLAIGDCSLRKDKIDYFKIRPESIAVAINGAVIEFEGNRSFIPNGKYLDPAQFAELKMFLEGLK